MNTAIDENAVRLELPVDAPPERAFQVFTENLDSWWPRHYRLGTAERVDARIEAHEGGRWYERTADGKEVPWGYVLACERPHRLVLSWQITPAFGPEPNPERASRVEVTFAAAGAERTMLTLVHSNFERHGEGWEATRAGVAHEGGWPGILKAYAALAAAPAEVPAS